MTEPADHPPIPPEPGKRPDQELTGFGNMPGGGKVAVVILWIQFGLSACASVLIIAAFGMLTSEATTDDWDVIVSEAPWVPPVLLGIVALIIGFTVLRAVFAVKIPQRSARARFWCVAMEVVGIALSLVAWALSASLDGDAMTESNTGGNCLGLILSIILIALLSTGDMQKWCNR